MTVLDFFNVVGSFIGSASIVVVILIAVGILIAAICIGANNYKAEESRKELLNRDPEFEAELKRHDQDNKTKKRKVVYRV